MDRRRPRQRSPILCRPSGASTRSSAYPTLTRWANFSSRLRRWTIATESGSPLPLALRSPQDLHLLPASHSSLRPALPLHSATAHLPPSLTEPASQWPLGLALVPCLTRVCLSAFRQAQKTPEFRCSAHWQPGPLELPLRNSTLLPETHRLSCSTHMPRNPARP